MTIITTRITTTELALVVLEAHAPSANIVERNGKQYVMQSDACGRCGGGGKLYCYSHIQAGTCFACNGALTMHRVKYTPVKEYAQDLKQRLNTAEKKRVASEKKVAKDQRNMIEGQRKWCEANGYGPITFAEKKVIDDKKKAEKKASTPDVLEGKHEIEVTIVSTKLVEDLYSYNGGMITKALVETANGARYYGTLTSKMFAAIGKITSVDDLNGKRLKFTATLQASKDDSKFGFYKRPSKVSLLDA